MTEATPAPPTRKRILTRYFLTGLATLMPMVLTAYIVVIVYQFVHRNFGSWLGRVLAGLLGQLGSDGKVTNPYTIAAGDILAVFIVLILAVFFGAMTASLFGRRIIRAGEKLLLKLPVVKVIYPYVKQVTDFILSEKDLRFHTVVALPYPRKGLYSLGFVTGRGFRTINEATEEELVQVFIPSSPTPITGYVLFVPQSDLIDLPVTVDQALRFAISGGVIVPPHEMIETALGGGEAHPLPPPKAPAPAAEDS
jgi:uncharacterized membrane protein